MGRCPKCKGFLYPRRVYVHHEESCIEIVCINCGYVECPEENRDLRILNRIVFNANLKTIKNKYPRMY